MLNRDIQLVALNGILFCCLIGCTVTTSQNQSGSSIPDGWSMAVAPSPEECVSIDGEYLTFGVGKFKEGDALTQARLDAVLGYTFPSEKTPEKVRFSLNREKNMLNVQFGQPINRDVLMSASCSDGKFRVEQRLTGQYLGDGTTLDYSISKIELAKSIDGYLILHVLSDIQSSSFLILKSRDLGESWSKFEPYENQN